MIELEKLIWSNWYSYGENNTIYFNSNRITQVLGKNGTGKSSIPLIIEEVIYGKNSRGVKKQALINRNNGANSLNAQLFFSKDNEKYSIHLDRKSTVKLRLFKNGVDISSHTATATYKDIEKIIGFDFKTFNQLIYQSSTSSLQFLTATDTQRKNFLILLFGLDKYLVLLDLFKEEYKTESKILNQLEGKCETISKWIDKYSTMELEEKELKILPELPENKVKELALLEKELKDIDIINKRISTNNTYKELLKQIDFSLIANPIDNPGNNTDIIEKGSDIRAKINFTKEKIKKINNLGDICHCCLQTIDPELKEFMYKEEYNLLTTLEIELEKIIIEHKEFEKKAKEYKAHKTAVNEFENLNSRVDNTIQENLLDEDIIKSNIIKLKENIRKLESEIKDINKENLAAEQHNSKIAVIKQQLVEYKNTLKEEKNNLEKYNDIISNIDILRKCFSPTGLVGYKLEYLVKDLEKEINKYLTEFSDGRFNLSFVLKNDKLNIEILDDNIIIEIESLSSGELARVNASTLLAIRKLMTELSKNKINLLFLDEIMGVLDEFGREKLIEILLEENDLNIFLVSHSYTHPLLEKITIIKENKVSRVENG